ncbi:unnamed protein product [Camellia sinensis]
MVFFGAKYHQHTALVGYPFPPTPTTQNTSFPGSSNLKEHVELSAVKPKEDVVVIGSGIAGLCCAGLLSRYQQDVLVLESHSLPGGAIHSFEKKGYKFDSGPSLFSGFQSRGPQANPLAQVLDALGESIPCANYDSWMVYLPEGDLEKYASLDAAREWRKLLDAILPIYAPSLLKSFAQMGPQGALSATKLLRPFSEIVDSLELKEPFIRNWIDLLAFLLAGVYMFAEWYKPCCSLEYPIHGTGAVVDAFVRGLQKFGGRISFKSHVENIVVENGRAVGVMLRSGQFVLAKKAVVSNASMWDTLDLLAKEVIPKSYQDRIKMTPQLTADISEDLKIHHIVVNDWERGVDADQNVVLISIPSVLSPNLAPPGILGNMCYMPICQEPNRLDSGKDLIVKVLNTKNSKLKDLSDDKCYQLRVLWRGVESRESASPQKCGGKAAYLLSLPNPIVLWRSVERAVGPGFNREKCEEKLVGTPLTHRRFLRMNRGTYGPALYCCGDSTFPGIGVPAVAASGAIVANSLVSMSQHSELLDAVGI